MVLIIVSNQVRAGEANIVCDACSIIEMKTKAKQELANSLPHEKYKGEYNLRVNVIDFYNDKQNTFAVSVYVDSGPVRPSDFKAKLITSSSKFKENMKRLKRAIKQVKTEVEASLIPSSVVSSPWRIPARSYVVNNIKDYIKSNVQVAIATTKIQSYVSAMGLIKTPLPNTFKIKLVLVAILKSRLKTQLD